MKKMIVTMFVLVGAMFAFSFSVIGSSVTSGDRTDVLVIAKAGPLEGGREI